VDRIVGRFRAAIASEAEAAEMAAASRAVTDAVFGGSLAGLPRVSRLAIVADGALFGVPFAALQGPSGRALVEDYRIEMASSLRAVLAAPARVPTASVRAIGDGHVPEPGLPHLPRADAEAEAVAALYPDARTLLGDTATRPAVLDAFGTSDVLHFAGHSVANIEHPQFAFLLAAPARGDAAGGAVFAKDIYARSFSRTSVVVLASCETAVGAPIFGEGPMSLAKPFLARGARYVVASLWRVDDAAASALAFAFHRALRLTGDPRIALRQAQASLLHATDPARRAPRAWGAFVVYIGEPIAGKDDR
jgi:CHAT domain-containing protein